tara:strand:- start:11953 stop:12186 length:234 start_codon:yes stop_codon:yes gene_type:complete
MKVSKELNLREFEFWSGAKYFANRLSYKELDQLEHCIEDLYPDGATETEINDLFWFEDDMLCEWIGLDSKEVHDRQV